VDPVSQQQPPVPGRQTELPPLVVVSILNWNGWRDTLQCLASVQQQDYPNFLTVVTDNASWDDSVEQIRGWTQQTLGSGGAFVEYTREEALAGGHRQAEQRLEEAESARRLVLIRNEENLGFTGGNNVAIHYALVRPRPADYVFLLNNDAVAAPDCISSLVRDASEAGAAMAEASISTRGHVLPPWGYNDGRARGRGRYSNVAAARGAAVLLAAGFLYRLWAKRRGYLDERLFMYMDDVELSWAARRMGERIIRSWGAGVRHDSPGRSTGGLYSPLEYYYGIRNSILLRFAWLDECRAELWLKWLARWAANAARHAVCGRWASSLAIFSGLVDGFSGATGKWRRHDEVARQQMAARREQPLKAEGERE
jgi:GT2 family glycosyltransferase